MWRVDYLQAVEPEALPKRDGIRTIIEAELDSMGFNRVAVCGESREAVLEYVRAGWGDDDAEWFREWVENRIEEFPDVQLQELDAEALLGEKFTAPAHNCDQNAVPYTNSGGPLGHGWECGVCGRFLQAG